MGTLRKRRESNLGILNVDAVTTRASVDRSSALDWHESARSMQAGTLTRDLGGRASTTDNENVAFYSADPEAVDHEIAVMRGSRPAADPHLPVRAFMHILVRLVRRASS